jgi:hypothetical protein
MFNWRIERMNFTDMKKRAKTGKDISSLTEKLDKLNNKVSYKDDRFWKPTKDKSGNSLSIIRFLPQAKDDDYEYVTFYNHGFDVNKRYFIKNCPTTIRQKCPVCEANKILWQTGDKSKKDIASSRKRKLSYITNIYVVSDPGEPDNEGKVFLFKFGPQIFAKIENALTPKYEDEKAFNPFNLWDGANFKLKVRNKKVDGKIMPTYEDSEFESCSALFDNDEVLKEIWEQEYKLGEFMAPENYDDYESLLQRFNFVVNGPAEMKKGQQSNAKPISEPDDEPQDDILDVSDEDSDEEFDDEMLEFRRLAEEALE